MAAFEPFLPNVQSGTAGYTQNHAVTGSAASITIGASTSGFAPCLLITNVSSATAFVRITLSTDTQAATAANDTPMLTNSSRVFANPAPNGTALVSVIGTSGTLYVTPGQGGEI